MYETFRSRPRSLTCIAYLMLHVETDDPVPIGSGVAVDFNALYEVLYPDHSDDDSSSNGFSVCWFEYRRCVRVLEGYQPFSLPQPACEPASELNLHALS